MMKKIILCILLPLQLFAQTFSKEETIRWEKQSEQVTIIRDNYGIPHIYGKTDAYAVFGLLYAQCEDDFKRVELNYVEKLGRLSEIAGEKDLYNDRYCCCNERLCKSSCLVKNYSERLCCLHQLLSL